MVAEFSWKEKNLDYEIETLEQDYIDVKIHNLEKKRTSITRLKPDKRDNCLTWTLWLEKKRTSITRLKPMNFERGW